MKLFQSTLPVRGATIRSPLQNRDTLFQSTLPVRGATAYDLTSSDEWIISIHAPREGSDRRHVLYCG